MIIIIKGEPEPLSSRIRHVFVTVVSPPCITTADWTNFTLPLANFKGEVKKDVERVHLYIRTPMESMWHGVGSARHVRQI